GIVPGLSIAAALALDQGIAIHLRDERAESHALRSIALWAGQWTSIISIAPPASVLLEIAGGLEYFGGLQKLLDRIDAGLAAVSFPGCTGARADGRAGGPVRPWWPGDRRRAGRRLRAQARRLAGGSARAGAGRARHAGGDRRAHHQRLDRAAARRLGPPLRT